MKKNYSTYFYGNDHIILCLYLNTCKLDSKILDILDLGLVSSTSQILYLVSSREKSEFYPNFLYDNPI